MLLIVLITFIIIIIVVIVDFVVYGYVFSVWDKLKYRFYLC